MYVCMYVCMYVVAMYVHTVCVHTYVCMYICMRIHESQILEGFNFLLIQIFTTLFS